MPLRVLLTGKLHGPEMAATMQFLYRAGRSSAISDQVGFIPLDARFKMLRDIKWESFNNDQTVLESVATVP